MGRPIRETIENKRILAECTEKFHDTIQVFAITHGYKLKDFTKDAVIEKYERMGGDMKLLNES